MDQRDGQTWVTLELSRAGEIRAEEGRLEESLRQALNIDDSHPVFVPSMVYSRDGKQVVIHLMQGYAFVGTGLHETSYFALERSCPYVRRVLAHPGGSGMRALSVISNGHIEDLRRQLRDQIATDITKGMRVLITNGTFAKLDGDVLELEGDEAYVRIQLRSIHTIATIPRVFLEPSEG